jgi:type IV secretory pathway VirB9-like protein
VQAFVRQLADFVQIEVLNQQGQFRFLRRLLNYDDWRVAGRPKHSQFLDYQVVNSDIEAERDHLRVGNHFVRILTMKEAIAETRPLVLDSLLKISGNFLVATEWAPITTEKARKEVNKRRRHFNVAKNGFISQLGNDPAKTNPRDVLIDESKQADIDNLGDCLRVLGDGQCLGDFSLSIVLHGPDRHELDRRAGEFTGVFTNADGNLFVETYNQLNAYFATVPGNYALNLRRMYLLNSNYADLSFLFTILPGEKINAHLGAEYLAVLETDNCTPYYLNLHEGEVAHTLILGMTGSGKSYLCCFLLQNAQKYDPLTFVFDIHAKLKYTTLIELPATEKIMEAATGDKEFWVVDVVGNFCFVHPAKAGIASNLNLITDKGNIYSFTLQDVSGTTAVPDLKVLIQPADRSAIVAASGPPQFVPAAQFEESKQTLAAVQSHVEQVVDEYRSAYPLQLKFDYSFKANESPFNIQSIYHDDKFTYIKTNAPEKFSVYEMKDGKPNLITYDLRDGTYIIPKVMDSGYVELGKKRMDFSRKG